MKQKTISGKPELLKRINRNSIIKLIFKHGMISRTEIAKETKLALPSVMRIVDELIAEKLVIEVGKGNSSGGRKPCLISMNHEHAFIVGVEIAINVIVVVTDLSGRIRERWESPQMAYQSPEAVLNAIYEKINEMILRQAIRPEQIAGIGVGTPGTNFKYHRQMSYAILKGWEAIDVKCWFENKLPYPVFIDNVARTRTLGELWFGIGKEVKNFVYVFVDQGVGCNIVCNGIIQEGFNGVAGEFGHTVIEYNGKACYCGNNGCIEMYVSAGAIINESSEFIRASNKTFLEVVLSENKPEIEAVLKRSAQILAVGVANLINILNPQTVVIGGIVPIYSKVFSSEVLRGVSEGIFSKYALDTSVVIGDPSLDFNCLGSVALVMNEIFGSVAIMD